MAIDADGDGERVASKGVAEKLMLGPPPSGNRRGFLADLDSPPHCRKVANGDALASFLSGNKD
jgi:hypothetical protein